MCVLIVICVGVDVVMHDKVAFCQPTKVKFHEVLGLFLATIIDL
jgi:hypothetical protein